MTHISPLFRDASVYSEGETVLGALKFEHYVALICTYPSLALRLTRTS